MTLPDWCGPKTCLSDKPPYGEPYRDSFRQVIYMRVRKNKRINFLWIEEIKIPIYLEGFFTFALVKPAV